MESDNTDSSESGMSDSWSVIETQAELDGEPGKQDLVERDIENIEDIASNSSDGESLEVIEEDITAHVEYMSDEETDGFSVISDSDCPVDRTFSDEIEWAPWATNKRKIYVHCCNPVLNSWLNFILIMVLATVAGLGLGHFIGSQENQFYPNELSKLRKMKSYNSPRDKVKLELQAQTLEVDKLTQSDKSPLELLDVLHKSEKDALESAQMSDTRTNELLDIMQKFSERTNYLLELVEQYDGRTKELLEFVQKPDERTNDLLKSVQRSDERTKELLEFVQRSDERTNKLLEFVQKSEERREELLEFVHKSDEKAVKTSEFINRYDTIAETWKASANLASKALNNPTLFKFLENGRETYVKTLGQTHSIEINTPQENVKSVIGENSVPFQETMTINKPNKDSKIVPANNVKTVIIRESDDQTADPSKNVFVNVTKAQIVDNEQPKETGPLRANETNANEYIDKINKQVESNENLSEDESPKQSSWLERVSNLVLALTPNENCRVTPLMELAESFEQSLNNLKKSIASGEPSKLLEKMKISAKKAQETASNLIHDVNMVKNKTLSKMLTKLTKFKNKLHDKWCYLKRQDNNYHILNWLESKIFEDCDEESNKHYKGSKAQNLENKRSVSNKMNPNQDNLNVSLKNTMKSHNNYEKKKDLKKYNELSSEDKRKIFKHSKNHYSPDSNTRKIYKDRPAGEKHFGGQKNPNSQKYSKEFGQRSDDGKHSKESDQRSDYRKHSKESDQRHNDRKHSKDSDRKHSKESDQRNNDRKHSKESDQRNNDRKHSKESDQRNNDRKHSKESDPRNNDRKHSKNSDQRNDATNYIRDGYKYTKESCHEGEYNKEPNSIGKLSTQDKCSNEKLENGWTINDKGEKSCNISGEWVIKLSKGRETSRKNNERSDWLFERAKARKVRRETDADQSEWYFDRAHKREHCRQHPNTDWCLSAKYSDLGPNKYDKYHEDDDDNDDDDDVEYWKTMQWSYQTPLRPLASAGKWFKNTFSEFKEKMNYYQNNQHKFNYV